MQQMQHTKTATRNADTSAHTSREQDWNHLQSELDIWGRKLDELQHQSNQVGDAVIVEMKRRYEVLKRETEALKASTDAELAEARKELQRISEEAEKDAETFYQKAADNARDGAATAKQFSDDMYKRSSETAKVMSESAQHIGTAFGNAWSELRKGFQQAYASLN